MSSNEEVEQVSDKPTDGSCDAVQEDDSASEKVEDGQVTNEPELPPEALPEVPPEAPPKVSPEAPPDAPPDAPSDAPSDVPSVVPSDVPPVEVAEIELGGEDIVVEEVIEQNHVEILPESVDQVIETQVDEEQNPETVDEATNEVSIADGDSMEIKSADDSRNGADTAADDSMLTAADDSMLTDDDVTKRDSMSAVTEQENQSILTEEDVVSAVLEETVSMIDNVIDNADNVEKMEVTIDGEGNKSTFEVPGMNDSLNQASEFHHPRRFSDEQVKTLRKLRSSGCYLCKVCGAQTIGRIYGSKTCHRCKALYRRIVLHPSPIGCVNQTENPGKCEINSKTRHKCLSCFSDKCRKNGLSDTGVKLHWNSTAKSLPAGTPARIRSLNNAFRKIFSICNRKLGDQNIKPELLTDRALEVGSPSYRHFMFSEFCQYYEPIVNNIVRFSKHIPGFDELPSDDQMILLKTGFMDVWIILNARNFLSVNDCITLYDNTQIPVCEFSTIYSKQYVSSVHNVVVRIKQLRLQSVEKALILSLVLTCPDRPNLLARNKVRRLQSSLLKILQRLTRITKPKLPTDSKPILDMLSSVYDVGKEHSQLLNFYRNHPEKLTVSPVIRELFDLHPQQIYREI